MSDAIRAKFAAKKTSKPSRSGRDAVTLFIASANAQAKKALEQKGKKWASKGTANYWFKPKGAGYVVFFGKKKIELDGAEYWDAKDLDEVAELLKDAATLADTDAEFQTAIRTASVAEDTPVTTTTKKRGRRATAAA